MRGVETVEQINLFDIERENLIKSATPIFTKGQQIYILSLDVVLVGTVSNSWVCGRDGDAPYFGYSIDFASGGHTVVWDYCIGKTVFSDPLDAEIAAEEIGRRLVKIQPEQIDARDVRAFAYRRNCDGYRITAVLAKVGETQLYKKAFYCYHFLRTFPTKQGRDKEYNAALKKMIGEMDRCCGEELSDPEFEVLYRVTDEFFASREYALNHGPEYTELRRGKYA